MDDQQRLDAEWASLNAFRGLAKITTNSDMSRSSYENSLNLGGEMYPDLLGPESSVLRQERESDLTKEYRQRAAARSILEERKISPVELLDADISEFEKLVAIKKSQGDDKQQIDRLKAKLSKMIKAKNEILPESHSENQLIFRDAYNVDRKIKSLVDGKGFRDFVLSDKRVLRLRVLHPDKPEHITGADLIYEKHNPETAEVSIVMVQYKIWEKRMLYLSNSKMEQQLLRMKKFACDSKLCDCPEGDELYRFPYCAAFLRPTDKLQTPNQKFISTGEHLPICKLDRCKTLTKQGASVLTYDDMKDSSISNDMFEYLFTRGKIGSRFVSYDELERVYKAHMIISSNDRVVIYAQDLEAEYNE